MTAANRGFEVGEEYTVRGVPGVADGIYLITDVAVTKAVPLYECLRMSDPPVKFVREIDDA